MEKRVAMIGAGVSGLLACKYTLKKGFNPIIFQAEEAIGGIWNHTIASTNQQNTKGTYQFSDFPFPDTVKDSLPSHSDITDYLESCARHKVQLKVVGINYTGESHEEVESWLLWSLTAKTFRSKGRWHIRVQNVRSCNVQLIQITINIHPAGLPGLYSSHPNLAEFPPNHCPEVFNGKAIHSMNFSAMDSTSAAELIKKKTIKIIGSQKSALETPAECATANEVEYSCTLIQRTAHLFIPSEKTCGVNIGFLYLNRLLDCWRISKFVEFYLRWKFPLKYAAFLKTSLHKTKTARLCKEGLILEGESEPVELDIVSLASGYRGGQKLRDIFESQFFQDSIREKGLSTSTIPLYRQVIHPRIPQLGIRCQWLAHLLVGNFELPAITEMEKTVSTWENFMRTHTSGSRRACISNIHVWNNDHLRLGVQTQKKGTLFRPVSYGPRDCAGLNSS
ncbi:hypothetical protein K2173_020828 [Erythroxylum novogranatense]|uniref:Flavin-containing monooxygenase n=1 Tax=Erythroxylum novogranatense TaxID=1862640 RepID=A0AAV8TNX3_9ROSI|nr:hypothetical protein K2173_020828 [Erythroxylum novogranatense]